MPTDPRPQIPFTVTFRCGHTADRKSRLATPEYIARKQHKAASELCPACRAEQERADREKTEAQREAILSQLPADATEAEKAVYLETQLCENVFMVISRAPFDDLPDPSCEYALDDSDIIETVTGIRKRSVENRLSFYARQYPDAHIALFSTSAAYDGMPIYVYR